MNQPNLDDPLVLRRELAKCAGWKWYGDYACNHCAGAGEQSLYFDMQNGPDLEWSEVMAACEAASPLYVGIAWDGDCFKATLILPPKGSHGIASHEDGPTAIALALIAACRDREGGEP